MFSIIYFNVNVINYMIDFLMLSNSCMLYNIFYMIFINTVILDFLLIFSNFASQSICEIDSHCLALTSGL